MQRINKPLSRCLSLNIAKYEPNPDLQWHTIELTNPLKGVVTSYSPLVIRCLLRQSPWEGIVSVALTQAKLIEHCGVDIGPINSSARSKWTSKSVRQTTWNDPSPSPLPPQKSAPLTGEWDMQSFLRVSSAI